MVQKAANEAQIQVFSPEVEKKGCCSILTNRIKNIWNSTFINWVVSSASVCYFSVYTVLCVSFATISLNLMYPVAAVCSFIYARHQRKGHSTRFWAEKSQFLTNWWQFKVRNLTKDQASNYEMGGTFCYYHPVYIEDGKTIFQGGQPSNNFNHLDTLKNLHNITLVINLTEIEEDRATIFSSPITPKQWEESGVKVERFPVKDFEIPNLDQLKAIVKAIEAHSGNIYIHCMSGMGRSSLPILGFLLSKGASIQEAKKMLKQRRAPVRIDGKPKIDALLEQYSKHLDDLMLEG